MIIDIQFTLIFVATTQKEKLQIDKFLNVDDFQNLQYCKLF